MFDIVPIDLLIEQLRAASFLRTKTHLQPYSATPNRHLKRWEQIVSRFDIPSNTDVIENTVMLNRPFNVNSTQNIPHILTEVKLIEKLDQDW